MRRFSSALLLLSVAILLASCTRTGNFDAGSPLSREELSSLSAAFYGTPEETTPLPNPEDTVYWTEGGSVYHLVPSCRHLQKSKEVKSGTLTHAMDQGKERLCSACAKP